MIDIRADTNLMTESFYKRILADAWKDNDITQESVINVLSSITEDIMQKQGTEIHNQFLECFWNYWQEYTKKQKEQTKNVAISVKKQIPKNNTVCENGAFKVKEKFQLKEFNAFELLKMDLPPIKYLVKDFIAEGLILLTAKSKSFKSWFCTQLCMSVSSGNAFLGMNTLKCDSLYIDLEENAQGLAQRLKMQSNGKKMPEGFHILFEVPTMDNGLIEVLDEYLDNHPAIKLVVIDVYAKIKMQKKSGITDYDADYQCLTILKKFAESRNLFLVLVSHNRKMVDEDDVFSNILGSTALMGTTDECIVIHRKKRTDSEFSISSTGRTIPSNEYKAKINLNNFNWELLGNAEEVEEQRQREKYEKDPFISTIKKLVAQNNGIYRGQVQDIIKASECFKLHIYDSPTALGKKMQSYIYSLDKYDSIRITVINKGTASKIYQFSNENPFITS